MDKKSAEVTISVNLGDLRLGIANLLIALHRTQQIDLARLLPALAEVNAQTWYQLEGEEELHHHSQNGTRLHLMLNTTLRPRWDASAPAPTL